MDRKALAIAVASLLVLGASRSASALTISSWSGSTIPSYSLSFGDLRLSGWRYDAGNYTRYTSYFSVYEAKVWDGTLETRVHPVPEPSAALVFGLGLISASMLARRKR